MHSHRIFTATALLAAGTVACAAHAGEPPEFALAISNHRFEPAELKVPAGQRVKLVVHNQDSTPEEFESHGLNREKVVPGGAKATIFIGPLGPGRYTFFGEYNEKTAQGAIVVD
jgi:plastocyanin